MEYRINSTKLFEKYMDSHLYRQHKYEVDAWSLNVTISGLSTLLLLYAFTPNLVLCAASFSYVTS